MITAAWLAHVDERRTIVRKVGVQDPVRTHTQNDLGECSLLGYWLVREVKAPHAYRKE